MLSKMRLRIRFTKSGDLRWISHLDLARLWERLLRRANLQLAFSEGFHPKPRINFPSALALGVEALDEIVELEILDDVGLEQIEADIRREMPPGMQLLSLESPSYSLGKARVVAAVYRIELPVELQPEIALAVASLLEQGSVAIEREKKVITCDARDPNFQLEVEDGSLIFALPTSSQASIRPSELLAYLGAGALLSDGVVLQRVTLVLKDPAPDGERAIEVKQATSS